MIPKTCNDTKPFFFILTHCLLYHVYSDNSSFVSCDSILIRIPTKLNIQKSHPNQGQRKVNTYISKRQIHAILYQSTQHDNFMPSWHDFIPRCAFIFPDMKKLQQTIDNKLPCNLKKIKSLKSKSPSSIRNNSLITISSDSHRKLK